MMMICHRRPALMGVYPPWQPVNVSFLLLLLFLQKFTNKFFFFFFFSSLRISGHLPAPIVNGGGDRFGKVQF